MARTESDVPTEVPLRYDGAKFRPKVPQSLIDSSDARSAVYVGELPRPGTATSGRVYPMGDSRNRIDVWLRAEQHPASES